MSKETIKIDGENIEVFFFPVPMMHEDFHEAEKLNIVYACYSAEGNDYWDNNMIFCKKEFKEKVDEYFRD